MRKFGFVIELFQKNELLAHIKLKVKYQGCAAEQLTKAKFIRTLENYMMRNETWKKKEGK